MLRKLQNELISWLISEVRTKNMADAINTWEFSRASPEFAENVNKKTKLVEILMHWIRLWTVMNGFGNGNDNAQKQWSDWLSEENNFAARAAL